MNFIIPLPLLNFSSTAHITTLAIFTIKDVYMYYYEQRIFEFTVMCKHLLTYHRPLSGIRIRSLV
jgi:hypothetical protein